MSFSDRGLYVTIIAKRHKDLLVGLFKETIRFPSLLSFSTELGSYLDRGRDCNRDVIWNPASDSRAEKYGVVKGRRFGMCVELLQKLKETRLVGAVVDKYWCRSPDESSSLRPWPSLGNDYRR